MVPGAPNKLAASPARIVTSAAHQHVRAITAEGCMFSTINLFHSAELLRRADSARLPQSVAQRWRWLLS